MGYEATVFKFTGRVPVTYMLFFRTVEPKLIKCDYSRLTLSTMSLQILLHSTLAILVGGGAVVLTALPGNLLYLDGSNRKYFLGRAKVASLPLAIGHTKQA